MKTVKALAFILLISGTFVLLSFQTAPIATPNITGLWADSNSVNFQHCYVIFSQTDNKIKMAHYLEFKETPMVEEGEGTITGNKVSYKVVVTKAIPGWALKGEHLLELSADGTTLRGIFKDEQGNTGPLVLKKVRP